MRKEPTRTERIVWQTVRGSALGLRVRRQHVLEPFIVDFYVPASRLVIEIDGSVHVGREAADASRDAALAYWHDVRVMHVAAWRVERELVAVLGAVRGAF